MYLKPDLAVVCAVPEHEPAEECSLSLVFFNRMNRTTETVPLGRFSYETDQTQLLAVYLAQSVHDVESLEDWDEIRGEGFSLCDEDFTTLDDRLSCAFHHLLLPENWSLLGDHKDQVARETLYHFCVRLRLVKFMRLLFTKPGAKLCLQIPNRHSELPRSLASNRQHEELHRILSDDSAVDRYAQFTGYNYFFKRNDFFRRFIEGELFCQLRNVTFLTTKYILKLSKIYLNMVL